MPEVPSGQPPRRRADAERNRSALLDAAASVFVVSGVDAPVRDIAAAAGVGVATIYRHFPTRSDLVVAVYRHQVEACAEAGPTLLADRPSPYDALVRWVDVFVDLLVTKHGLAAALRAVLTDRRTTRRTREAARAHVDTAYSWPVLAERVHDVYADVQRR